MKRWMAALLCVCMVLGGCRGDEKTVSRDAFALDTYCTVTLYTDDTVSESDAAHTLDRCMTHLAQRERLWSQTIRTSDISRLNAADGAVMLDKATVTLLQTAAAFCDKTDGAFDVTTAAVSAVWKTAEENGTLPSSAAIAEALSTVGSENIVIDSETAALKNGAAVDLGGIAKGQIADEIAAIIRESGGRRALIDLGGNIVAVGGKADGTPFHIGIAHPTEESALIATVAVTDRAVVTSGSYERGFSIDGKRYSHIVDPKTGQPVADDLLSVTIIAPLAVTADALSTACFVKGYAASLTLLEAFEEAEAVFVLTDGTVKTTAGVTLV